MHFAFPQFIEREARIIGPLTFKRFIIIATGGGMVAILYFTLAPKNFFAFLSISIIIIATSVSLAFLKIGGVSLMAYSKNFLFFSAGSKIYIWKRKNPPIFQKIEMRKGPRKKEEKKIILEIGERSLLKKLKNELELSD